MGWELHHVDKLDGEALHALLDNEIAGIVLTDFVDAATLHAAVAGIRRHGMEFYEAVDPPIGRIGITQFEHRHTPGSKAAYFAAAPAANQRRHEVFAGSGDLFTAVAEALGAAWPAAARLATEDDGSEYFAGLIRVIGQGLLHCDWAPHDAPGWAIGAIDAQLTWNIYCQVPEQGGATAVYDRPWTDDAERMLIPGSYGYDEAVVSGRRCARIEPAPGELTLFNSRNFHAIEPSRGADRISVSSFAGRAPSGELLLWS